MFNIVLFPIDQSREAREAAEVVANVVQKYGSRLVLLSVLEPVDSEEPSSADVMASPMQLHNCSTMPIFVH